MRLIQMTMTVFLGVVLACASARAEDKPQDKPAKDATRQGIVVWRLEAKTGVTEKDIDSISGYITSEVEKYSGMKVVSDADIKTILSGEEKLQQCGADSTSCIAEIGSALGVPEAVSGDLGKMGDYWILNLRRINVRSATVISRVGRQIKGDVNALIEAVPGAVAELFGKEAPKPVEKEPEAKVESPAEPAKKMNAYRIAAFSTFFPGLALVAFGGIAQWQMNRAQDDYDGGDRGAQDRHSTWKGLSAAGYAVGGAAMATGIVLWIVEATRDKKDDSAPGELKASGVISPLLGGAAVRIEMSW